MATGGHHDGKELRQKMEPPVNGNNLSDRAVISAWTSLTNNLVLNTRSKPTKKQRNKEKSRGATHSPCANASNKFFDLSYPSSSSNDHSTPAKRNVKGPVNQGVSYPTFQHRSTLNATMENGNTIPGKDEYAKKQPETTAIRQRLEHLQDCITQANTVLQHLKQSDDPTYKAEIPCLESMLKVLSQDEQAHQEILRQQIMKEAQATYDEQDDSDSDDESPVTLSASEGNARETNGAEDLFLDEDKENIQNHLLEKMKSSQEKLTALKQQQTFLLTMRKNAEEKLAAFQAELAKASSNEQVPRDWQCTPEMEAAGGDDSCFESGWKTELGAHVQLPPQNLQKAGKTGPKPSIDENGASGVNVLHVNLENIKRRLQVLQECADNRNVIESSLKTSTDAGYGENLNERLVAVQWQRKKLKNRLLELQEKKKASDELMKELSLIKDAANAVEQQNGEEIKFNLSSIADTPELSLYENNQSGALEAIGETISQLRGMLNTRSTSSLQAQENEPANFPSTSSQEDALTKQNSYQASPGKRDNIKKGQSDQFPARRHYEAEGRANEDPDVPVPLAAVVSPSTDMDSRDKAFQAQSKKREQMMKEKQQVIQTMLDSLRGKFDHIPNSVLQAISTLDEDQLSSGNDSETATDNEESQGNIDSDSAAEEIPTDITSHSAKEENIELHRRCQDNERPEAAVNLEDIQNLEELKNEGDRLLKLHQKFTRLHHKFFSAPKQNNEEARSSGEGGNLQKRKSRVSQPVSVSNHIPPVPLRQENLLTRQNVATVESQSRNNSSNIAHGSNTSLKKDNINDLSAKYNKAGRSGGELLCKFRTDVKTFRDSMPNKSSYVDLMKQDRNKLQNYSRNHDMPVHSNSSINSEPFDGSSSAIAQDTTVAATWGGSSTQENFEDDHEAFGSMGDPEEEESHIGDTIAISVDASMNENILEGETASRGTPKRLLSDAHYSNYSLDSSTKRRDNRLNKYFKSTQHNQWDSRKKNFAQSTSQRNQTSTDSTRDLAAAEDVQVQVENASQASTGSTNPVPMQEKFMQKLQQQLEQLNALCRPVIQENPASSAIPCQPVTPLSRDNNGLLNLQFPVPNSVGRVPPVPVPDMLPNYTQQLQLQQQLLLSLSQCYYALYVQQLEISHLHRCVQQCSDSDASLHQPAATVDDFTFRPCFPAPWLNTTVSSVLFPPGQVSPMSAPPFVQPGQQPFSFTPNSVLGVSSSAAAGNASGTPAPCALVTSMPPARAVVHPAAQDTRTNAETLNNQVPPRTRANNFWDNFRSQSRQNLLSANATKGKDGSCSTSGPQVRQVHPLVSNESTWGHRSKVFIPPHSESSTTVPFSSASTSEVRSFVRPVSNPDYQGSISKSKKPNLNRAHGSHSLPDSTTSASTSFSACPEPDHALRFPEESPSLDRSTKPRAGAAAAISSQPSQPLPDTIHSEISTLLAQNNGQESYLEELLRELRNLKTESLPRALSAVRELASHERTVTPFPPARHFENNSHPPERISQLLEARPDGHAAATSSSDMSPFKVACENACQRSNQNWPAATIIPLGKHVAKPSTGAVKKRSSSSSGAFAREPVPGALSSPWVLPSVSESQPAEEKLAPSSRTDSVENAVERVVFDLIPFVQSHMGDDCCTSLRATFATKAIEALKHHCSVPFTPDFFLQLHQMLMQLTSKYANSKWCDSEADMMKNVAAALFREVAMFKSLSLRLSLEDCSEHPPSKNAQPDLLPSSSSSLKLYNDGYKQIVPSKDHSDDPGENDGSSVYPLQESDSTVGELYVNMSSEDTDMPVHSNGNIQHEPIRGAIGGISPISGWAAHTIKAEEDNSYECDPEAETEPEVETGTEADLAEADQSPGQQASTNGLLSSDVWHAPCSANVEESAFSESSAADAAAALNLPLTVQGACSNGEKEITLDDIPTKLTALSQEELQRQFAEEQEGNMLLAASQLENTDDISLVGNGDCLKDPPTFV